MIRCVSCAHLGRLFRINSTDDAEDNSAEYRKNPPVSWTASLPG